MKQAKYALNDCHESAKEIAGLHKSLSVFQPSLKFFNTSPLLCYIQVQYLLTDNNLGLLLVG